MRICVTGGNGFIGRQICGSLTRAGHAVVVLDLAPPDSTSQAACTYIQGDVRNHDSCVAAFAGCDRVLHLAAAHKDFGITESEYFDVNEHGTATVCKAMITTGVRDLCFYSSVAVYGDAPPPRNELTTPSPTSHYGASKLAAERVAEGWAHDDASRRCLVIRPTVVFGPESRANMYSLVHQIATRRFVMVGDPETRKSLAYIDNLVSATMFLWGLSAKDCPVPACERIARYNYVDKPDIPVGELVGIISDHLFVPRPRLRFPLWLGLVAALPFDAVSLLTGLNLPISRARVRKLNTATVFESSKINAAGFSPAVSLNEGVARMVEWYMSVA